MKKLAFVIAPLALLVVAMAVVSTASPPPPPPPVQNPLVLTDANDPDHSDRKLVEEHKHTIMRLAELAQTARRRQAQYNAAVAAVTSYGAMIRRAMVRQNSAADAILPASLLDAEVDDFDSTTDTSLYWNALAEEYRKP